MWYFIMLDNKIIETYILFSGSFSDFKTNIMSFDHGQVYYYRRPIELFEIFCKPHKNVYAYLIYIYIIYIFK